MPLPVFNLLRFDALMNACLVRFFADEQDNFKRLPDGRYVYAGGTALRRAIERYYDEETAAVTRKFDLLKPEYFIIIGGCEPRDNILLPFAETIPPKLRKLIWSGKNLKYILRERDIIIDEECLNGAIDEVFQKTFSGSAGKTNNVTFIRNRRLDSYAMEKTLEFIIGRQHCVTYRPSSVRTKRCLISINDLIDKHVNNKSVLNRMRSYAETVDEIRQYLSETLKIDV